jgi:hypothetical protein
VFDYRFYKNNTSFKVAPLLKIIFMTHSMITKIKKKSKTKTTDIRVRYNESTDMDLIEKNNHNSTDHLKEESDSGVY